MHDENDLVITFLSRSVPLVWVFWSSAPFDLVFKASGRWQNFVPTIFMWFRTKEFFQEVCGFTFIPLSKKMRWSFLSY